MRELQLAVHPSIETDRDPAGRARVPFKLSRTAFAVSVGVHVLAGYALSRQVWPAAPPQISFAEFFLFEAPQTRLPETEPASPAEPLPAEPPAPSSEVRQGVTPTPQPDVQDRLAPTPQPAPRAAEPANDVIEPVEPPSQAAPAPAPPSFVDFDEARQRAAREVIAAREADSEYLTFSIDDVAPPRVVAEPKPARSIFDGGSDFGGRSVAKLGQQRTRLGRKLADLCNALTGGFGVALQGLGLFSACASPDDGPSGLFPEVRPAYLDLMPECVETRPLAEKLGEESPFPTVKCRLVKQEDAESQP